MALLWIARYLNGSFMVARYLNGSFMVISSKKWKSTGGTCLDLLHTSILEVIGKEAETQVFPNLELYHN